MTLEELNVKITADRSKLDSEIDATKAKLKQFHNDVGKNGEINVSKNVAAVTKATSKTVSGVSKVTESFKSLANNALSKVTANMGEMGNVANGALSGMSSGAVAAAGAVAGVVVACAAVVKKLVDISNEVSALGDKIDKTSQSLNMSYGTYQKWDYIMHLCGTSAEELKEGLNQMMTQMSSARSGDKNAVGYFKQLGVNITDANGNLRDSNTVFTETINSLQRMENRTERAALAQRLFGENASKLAPLFNMSAQQMNNASRAANVLGLTMNNNTVAMSAKYTDTLYTFQQAWLSVKYTIAEAVLPVLQSVVKYCITASTYINVAIRTLFSVGSASKSFEGIGEGAKKAQNKIAGIGSAANTANSAVSKLKRQLMGFDELNVMSSQSAGSGGIGVADSLANDLAAIGDFNTAFDSLFSDSELKKIEEMKEKIKKICQPIGDVITWINRVWESLKPFRGIIEIMEGITTGNIPLIIKGIKDLRESIDPLKDKFAEVKKWVRTNILNKISNPSWWYFEVYDPIVSAILNIPILAPLKYLRDKVIKPWFTKNILGEDLNQTNWNAWFSGAFGGLGESVRGSISGAWGGAKGYFAKNINPTLTSSYWSNKTKGIKDGIRTTMNGTISIIEAGCNNISRAINGIKFGITSSMNGAGWNVKSSMGATKIARLATGGIATQSTIANIGEAGKEAVLPLENNTGWMDMLADRLANRQNAPSKIVLMVDKKELAWANINSINDITKQTGAIPLTIC